MAYIFDTNIFIRSKHELPVDVWPTFWREIARLIQSGQIFSSIKVKEEIERGGDELTDWMRNNVVAGFYIPIEPNVLTKYADVTNWANTRSYTLNAVNEFASVADSFLVATAAAKGLTLVTFETPDSNSKKRVKIPDACVAMGVNYCDLNTALRNLGISI